MRFSAPVTIKTLHYVKTHIYFDYPALSGLSDPAKEQKMNDMIHRFVKQMVSELYYMEIPTDVSGYYEVKTNERGILSIAFLGSGDFLGAHPIQMVRSLTFDIKKGEAYPFYELFEEEEAAFAFLSRWGKESFIKRKIDFFEDSYLGVKKRQDYYVVDHMMVIYFQQYEIGPRSIGFPFFWVPLEKLENHLTENSFLKRLIPFL